MFPFIRNSSERLRHVFYLLLTTSLRGSYFFLSLYRGELRHREASNLPEATQPAGLEWSLAPLPLSQDAVSLCLDEQGGAPPWSLSLPPELAPSLPPHRPLLTPLRASPWWIFHPLALLFSTDVVF